MTPRQMQIAFQDAFDRAGLDLEITSTELFKELNEAQDVLVSRLYREFEKDNMISAGLAPFVVRNTAITTAYTGISTLDGFSLDRGALPANFRFFIALRAGVEWVYGGYTDTDVDEAGENPTYNRTVLVDPQQDPQDVIVSKLVRVKMVQQDDIYAVLLDPFSKPLHRSPVAVLHDTYVDAYADDFSFVIPTLYLDYVKKPDTIALTYTIPGVEPEVVPAVPSEFPDHLHREIVDLAVERYLQRVTTVRSTSKKAE